MKQDLHELEKPKSPPRPPKLQKVNQPVKVPTKVKLNKKEAEIDPDSISMDNASDDEVASYSDSVNDKAPALA